MCIASAAHLQGTCAFRELPKGNYQLMLHLQKRKIPRYASDTFTISVEVQSTQPPWERRSYTASYYDRMYSKVDKIATNMFTVVRDDCEVTANLYGWPAGLKSVQLQRMRPGSVVATSLQWEELNPCLPRDSHVGFCNDRTPLWISLRLGDPPELGRTGREGEFLYGRHGSYKEYDAPQADVTFRGRVGSPAVLVNVDEFDWVTTSIDNAHRLRDRAVPLANLQDWSLHAARVVFHGWDQQILKQHNKHIMSCTGPVICVLPGKLEIPKDGGLCRAMFTWKGKATGGSKVKLGEHQDIQVLCYRVFCG